MVQIPTKSMDETIILLLSNANFDFKHVKLIYFNIRIQSKQ